MATPAATCNSPIDPSFDCPRALSSRAYSKGSVFGHKVVHIHGRGDFIDASRNGNTALFPYHGLHTLRKTQFIFIGMLALIIAMTVATALITGGASTILGGLAIGALLAGGPVALVGSLAVHFGNRYDPTMRADQRHYLLDNQISDVYSPDLTASEKASLFARDARYFGNPRRASDDFRHLFQETIPNPSLQVLADRLDGLEKERTRATAPVEIAAAVSQYAVNSAWRVDRAYADMESASGALAMAAGARAPHTFAGSLATTIGEAALLGGTVRAIVADSLHADRSADIDYQRMIGKHAAETSIAYHQRRRAILDEAAPFIRELKIRAAASAPSLSHTLVD